MGLGSACWELETVKEGTLKSVLQEVPSGLRGSVKELTEEEGEAGGSAIAVAAAVTTGSA